MAALSQGCPKGASRHPTGAPPPPANRSPIVYSPLPDTATHKGTFRAAVPSGASTGIYEAVELRDGGDA